MRCFPLRWAIDLYLSKVDDNSAVYIHKTQNIVTILFTTLHFLVFFLILENI